MSLIQKVVQRYLSLTREPQGNGPDKGPVWYEGKIAAIKRLDLDWVESLRKDFLALLKNLPRVKDYKTAHELKEAFHIYRKNFDELVFEQFLNQLEEQLIENLGWDRERAKRQSDSLNRTLRAKAWDFSIELSVPIGFKDKYWSEGDRFATFQREYSTWKTRVQRKAQVFWKTMKDVIAWFENVQNTPLTIRVQDVEKAVVEGFQLIMKGYQDNEHDQEGLERLREGLHRYRHRAAQVAPILLRKQLPIIAEFKVKLDKGGTYNHDGTITFWVTSVIRKDVDWVAHVLAHEMGHHLWQTVLSDEAQTFWNMTIRGDYGEIDLKELLDKWPEGAWAFEFSRYTSDPILGKQVETLHQDPDLEKYHTKEDFQRLYDNGTRKLNVPRHPITGYAGKNPEEAFCETIGLLVSKGPGAVHDQVKYWFHTALPGAVKLASTKGDEL